ncbi:MAG: TetR/AcrR family transcriptional regulator [Planctomycetota bacterium]
MPRGRPPKFDEQQVLDTAAAMFKRDGYDAVSVADLSKETGMAMQSLYHRFGDKAGLYREALNRYGRTANDPQIEALLNEPDAAAALRNFVRAWRRHAGADASGGCLFTQAMAGADPSRGLGELEVTCAFTDRLRKALRKRVAEAQAAGDVPAGSPGAGPGEVADGLMTLAFGVAVIGRGGMPAAMVDHAVRAGLRLLGE